MARCQRPDGSHYGTAGQCRKGTPVEQAQEDLASARVAVEKASNAMWKGEQALKKGEMGETDFRRLRKETEKAVAQYKKAEQRLDQVTGKRTVLDRVVNAAPRNDAEYKPAPKRVTKKASVQDGKIRVSGKRRASKELPYKTNPRVGMLVNKDGSPKRKNPASQKGGNRIAKALASGMKVLQPALQFGEDNEYISQDFARCERPDGSHYGTGGQCRKGTPVEDRMYEPKAPKGVGVSVNTDHNGDVLDSGYAKGHEKANAKFLKRVAEEMPPGNEVRVGNLGDLEIAAVTKGGNKIVSSLNADEGYGFMVNRSFNAGKIKDRREQVAIAMKVKQQYDAMVRALPVGATIMTSAWSGDGQKMYESRVKAYERVGFSSPKKKGGKMYSTKQPDGRMGPSNRDAAMKSYKNPDHPIFSEQEEHDEIRAWMEVAGVGLSCTFDFARCERPDGSGYGTAGVCRKGVPAEKAPVEKKKGRYYAKDGKNKGVAPGTGDINKGPAAKGHEKANTEFMKKLAEEMPAGNKIAVTDNDGLTITGKTKGGTEIKSYLNTDEGYGFKVNGKYDAGSITDRREQVAVAMKTKEQYDAVVRALPPGSSIATRAWLDTLEGYNSRVKAYERMGYSKPRELGGEMYSTKQTDGSMKPTNRLQYKKSEKNPKAVYFSEADYSEASGIKLWVQLIFGGK